MNEHATWRLPILNAMARAADAFAFLLTVGLPSESTTIPLRGGVTPMSAHFSAGMSFATSDWGLVAQ